MSNDHRESYCNLPPRREMDSGKNKKKDKDNKPKVKAYLHVVYAGFGDASILEFKEGE